MQVPVKLNGEKAILEGDCDEKLLSVLRRRQILSPKEGCAKGRCGFCTVLLDAKPIPSCIVPLGILRDSTIETLEHFTKTKRYEDIAKGFEESGIKLCGYCNASKIFSIWYLLEKTPRPSQLQIEETLNNLSCTCTDRKSLKSAIHTIIKIKLKREVSKKDVLF